jgi:hypothetical protein
MNWEKFESLSDGAVIEQRYTRIHRAINMDGAI